MEEQNTEGLLMEKQYKIPFDLFRDGFAAFQRKFVYPRTYAVMAALLAVCGLYGYFIARADDSTNTALYVMIILFCLTMCAFQWWNPKKIRCNLLEGVREIEEDEYRLRIFPEYIEIGNLLPPEEGTVSETDALFDDVPEENFSGTRIYYNKGLHIIEYPTFFMIYLTKAMFYVVPKSAFSEEELEILRVHFSQRLNKTFETHK